MSPFFEMNAVTSIQPRKSERRVALVNDTAIQMSASGRSILAFPGGEIASGGGSAYAVSPGAGTVVLGLMKGRTPLSLVERSDVELVVERRYANREQLLGVICALLEAEPGLDELDISGRLGVRLREASDACDELVRRNLIAPD